MRPALSAFCGLALFAAAVVDALRGSFWFSGRHVMLVWWHTCRACRGAAPRPDAR
jgi:hypothetical protein